MTIVKPPIGYTVAEVWKQDGKEMTHHDFERQRLEEKWGRSLTKVDFERDPDLQCAGVMARYGNRETNDQGHVIVHWEGNALSHSLFCSSCGAEWAIDTPYARALREELSDSREEKRDAW